MPHAAETLAKKLNIRKALKNITFANVEKAKGYLNQDDDNENKKIQIRIWHKK